MFTNNKRVQELLDLNLNLSNRLNLVDKRYKDLTDTLAETSRKAPVSIDFITMNAFSIERLLNDRKVPYTNIGYFLRKSDGSMELKEWFLYVSEEIHNTLVVQFNEYIVKKNARYSK